MKPQEPHVESMVDRLLLGKSVDYAGAHLSITDANPFLERTGGYGRSMVFLLVLPDRKPVLVHGTPNFMRPFPNIEIEEREWLTSVLSYVFIDPMIIFNRSVYHTFLRVRCVFISAQKQYYSKRSDRNRQKENT